MLKQPRNTQDDNRETLRVPKADKRYKSVSHKRAPQQEAALAKRVKGTVVKGSGCGAQKGDVVITGLARIECKTTFAKGYSVTRELVEKTANACREGEVPVIQLDFTDREGALDESCYVVPKWAMEVLLEKAGLP